MKAAEAKAVRIVAGRSTEQLVTMFEMTETMDGENIPTVRGWIMDELEHRDPEAFDKWLDSMEDSPRRFYAA